MYVRTYVRTYVYVCLCSFLYIRTYVRMYRKLYRRISLNEYIFHHSNIVWVAKHWKHTARVWLDKYLTPSIVQFYSGNLSQYPPWHVVSSHHVADIWTCEFSIVNWMKLSVSTHDIEHLANILLSTNSTTRKCGKCDALQLEWGHATLHPSFSAFSETPICRVWSRSTYSFCVTAFFTPDTLRYVEILTFDFQRLILDSK